MSALLLKKMRLMEQAASAVVTVSGEVITDTGAGARTYRAAAVFRTGGTVDKIVNTTTTQIDNSTDWLIPNGDAPADYEVKYDLISGPALDGSTSLADGVWGALTADKFFEQRRTAIGSSSSTITISVRKGSGSVLDSATYVLTADRLF